MAYYLVKICDKDWMNQELACDLFNVPIGELSFHIIKNKINTNTDFDRLLIELPNENKEDLKRFSGIIYQDVDNTISQYKRASDLLDNDVMNVSCPIFTSNGNRFIKISDLSLSGKYAMQDFLPSVKVGKTIFVMLDSVRYPHNYVVLSK